MDILTKRATGDFLVVMDADCVFLKKHWDDLLIEKLTGNVACIETPKSIPNNKDQEKRNNNFPCVFAVMYVNSIFKNLSPSFMPDKNWLASEDKSGLLNKDTGWDIQRKFEKHGYCGISLEARNTREYKNGKFSDILCVEYYDENGVLVCNHFGRGATLGVAKYKQFNRMKLLKKIPMIKNYLRKRQGLKERAIWIKRCRDIIKCESAR